MKFKVDEISSVITEEIQKYRSEIDVSEVGKVLEVGDGIARIYGLSNAMAGERLKPGDWVEISGVCTHPDGRGRGYAQALVSMIQQQIHARGKNTFLHVVKTSPSVKTATGVYERLGFRHHQTVYVSILQCQNEQTG